MSDMVRRYKLLEDELLNVKQEGAKSIAALRQSQQNLMSQESYQDQLTRLQQAYMIKEQETILLRKTVQKECEERLELMNRIETLTKQCTSTDPRMATSNYGAPLQHDERDQPSTPDQRPGSRNGASQESLSNIYPPSDKMGLGDLSEQLAFEKSMAFKKTLPKRRVKKYA